MLIKKISNEKVIVLNVNIDAYTALHVKDKQITFSNDNASEFIPFSTEEEANEALDRIFDTYGMSAPMNKVLDLTKPPVIIETVPTTDTSSDTLKTQDEVVD